MKPGVTKAVTIAAAGAVIAISLGACSNANNNNPTNPTDTAPAALIPISVSYSEEAADEVPLWIAKEAGYFKDHGLDVTLLSLPSDQGFPALLSGQVQLAAMGGTQIVSGAAAGADVKILVALTPVYPYQIYANVATMAELKGKKFGYTSKSGSQYIGTLAALKQAGIDPADVNLVPLGSITNVNNALLAGTIDAAATHPPASVQFADNGLHMVLDLAQQKLPNIALGVSTMTAYMNDHPDVIEKFMAALKQGFDREKSDEAYATQVLSQHVGVTDQRLLDATWQFYANEVRLALPIVTVESLDSSRQVLIGSVDGVENLDLAKLIDTTYVTKAFQG